MRRQASHDGCEHYEVQQEVKKTSGKLEMATQHMMVWVSAPVEGDKSNGVTFNVPKPTQFDDWLVIPDCVRKANVTSTQLDSYRIRVALTKGTKRWVPYWMKSTKTDFYWGLRVAGMPLKGSYHKSGKVHSKLSGEPQSQEEPPDIIPITPTWRRRPIDANLYQEHVYADTVFLDQQSLQRYLPFRRTKDVDVIIPIPMESQDANSLVLQTWLFRPFAAPLAWQHFDQVPDLVCLVPQTKPWVAIRVNYD